MTGNGVSLLLSEVARWIALKAYRINERAAYLAIPEITIRQLAVLFQPNRGGEA